MSDSIMTPTPDTSPALAVDLDSLTTARILPRDLDRPAPQPVPAPDGKSVTCARYRVILAPAAGEIVVQPLADYDCYGPWRDRAARIAEDVRWGLIPVTSTEPVEWAGAPALAGLLVTRYPATACTRPGCLGEGQVFRIAHDGDFVNHFCEALVPGAAAADLEVSVDWHENFDEWRVSVAGVFPLDDGEARALADVLVEAAGIADWLNTSLSQQETEARA